jgi:hypothetical protein
MEDVKFLRDCGIEIDPRWLAELLGQEASPEAANYVRGLLKITDMLAPGSTF